MKCSTAHTFHCKLIKNLSDPMLLIQLIKNLQGGIRSLSSSVSATSEGKGTYVYDSATKASDSMLSSVLHFPELDEQEQEFPLLLHLSHFLELELFHSKSN